jgi:hypothetical protein
MNFKIIPRIYGLLFGMTSTIFMLWVFFNEAFLGRGVTYIEPNIGLATLEFLICLSALVIISSEYFLTMIRVGKRK